jgi:hypothetical protein
MSKSVSKEKPSEIEPDDIEDAFFAIRQLVMMTQNKSCHAL